MLLLLLLFRSSVVKPVFPGNKVQSKTVSLNHCLPPTLHSHFLPTPTIPVRRRETEVRWWNRWPVWRPSVVSSSQGSRRTTEWPAAAGSLAGPQTEERERDTGDTSSNTNPKWNIYSLPKQKPLTATFKAHKESFPLGAQNCSSCFSVWFETKWQVWKVPKLKQQSSSLVQTLVPSVRRDNTMNLH